MKYPAGMLVSIMKAIEKRHHLLETLEALQVTHPDFGLGLLVGLRFRYGKHLGIKKLGCLVFT
jgi:hypothetical protein